MRTRIFARVRQRKSTTCNNDDDDEPRISIHGPAHGVGSSGFLSSSVAPETLRYTPPPTSIWRAGSRASTSFNGLTATIANAREKNANWHRLFFWPCKRSDMSSSLYTGLESKQFFLFYYFFSSLSLFIYFPFSFRSTGVTIATASASSFLFTPDEATYSERTSKRTKGRILI